MAYQTTVQFSPVTENQDIEYCENGPPGVIAFSGTSELKDQGGDTMGSSTALQSGQNVPHSAFSIPTPKHKHSNSGFPSTLTPILKQLNIHNCSSPSTFVNSSELKAPSLFFCDTDGNSQRVTDSNQSSSTDTTQTLSRQFLGDANSPVHWLVDESFPEITFLDVSCGTPEQLSKNDPGARSVSERSSSRHHHTSQYEHPSRVFHVTQDHSQVSKGEMMAGKRRMILDVPRSIDTPFRLLDDKYFPEITLLDLTPDSDFSPKGEIPPLEVKQDVPVSGSENNLPSSVLGGEAEAEPGPQDTIHTGLSRTLVENLMDTVSSVCEHSDKDIVNHTPNISLGVTRDISMGSALEDSRPSLESSGQCSAMSQTSVKGAPGVHPLNVTHDISCPSCVSVHCAGSHTQQTRCNSSLQNLTSVLHSELEATSTHATAHSQELLTKQLSSTSSEHSPEPTGSLSDTFTIVPDANRNPSVPADGTAQRLSPQNKAQDLSPSNGSSPKSQKDVNDQPPPESHLGLSVKDGFPNASGHQSSDTVENKANTFNLDDTLELKGDALLTSTPMFTCKRFNFSTERERKSMGAPKKLHGGGPSDHQLQAEVPSNIVCDRITLLSQPAAKSMLPPLKTASQLVRYKSASGIPRQPEPSVSGLPVTRQKTQALRTTDPSQVVGYEPD